MNWNKLLDALCFVESDNDASAVGDNGLAVGVLQAHPCVLQDIQTVYGIHFEPHDRYNAELACVMCVLYVTWYCRYDRLLRPATAKDYALCWHYGPDFMEKDDPHGYWDKVRIHIN